MLLEECKYFCKEVRLTEYRKNYSKIQKIKLADSFIDSAILLHEIKNFLFLSKNIKISIECIRSVRHTGKI